MLLVVCQLVNCIILNDHRGVHDCRDLFVVASQSQHAFSDQIQPLRALCWTHGGYVGLRVVNNDEIRSLFHPVWSLVCHATDAASQTTREDDSPAARCPLACRVFDRRQDQRVLPPNDIGRLALICLAPCPLCLVFQMRHAPADLGEILVQQIVRHQLRFDALNVVLGCVFVGSNDRNKFAVPIQHSPQRRVFADGRLTKPSGEKIQHTAAALQNCNLHSQNCALLIVAEIGKARRLGEILPQELQKIRPAILTPLGICWWRNLAHFHQPLPLFSGLNVLSAVD